MVPEELISLWKIAYPILITSLVFHAKSIISMHFLGHLGDIELAAGSLSTGVTNIIGHSVIKGLAMGMEPICSQAYGARNWSLFRDVYKKTGCLVVFTGICLSLGWWVFIEKILLTLRQNQAVTSMAKVYITYSIPDLIAQALLHPLRIFLRTQNITKPLTISVTCSTFLHLLINYVFAVHFNFGVRGVAMASACNTVITILGVFLYLFRSEKAVKPWDREAINECRQGWKPLLALMLSSVISVCLEWWWYEIMIILTGLLSDPQASVSAMGILIQATGVLYVIPHSLSQGLSSLVGQALGAMQPACARRMAKMGILVASIWGIVAWIITVMVRNILGRFYTDELEVLALTSAALPILGFCELGNSSQTAANGILTGSARQKSGAYINLVSFYLVGFPVAAFMTLVLNKGLNGFWYGLAAAQFAAACLMICIIVFTDWNCQAERARELTQTKDEEAALLS